MEFKENIDAQDFLNDSVPADETPASPVSPTPTPTPVEQQTIQPTIQPTPQDTPNPEYNIPIKGNSSTIWTEKYRPSEFEDVVGQDEIVKRVQSLTKSLNIPHMLFAGPAGIGKSTLAIIVAKQLFGDTWRENYLELNASDTRGIDVVRQEVKSFARTKSLGNVPFKIIFLDEADALTKEAQQALRRTMENYTSTL